MRPEGIVRAPTPEAKRKLREKMLCGRPWVECHYCGARLTDSEITVDHIVPRSKGGTNWISNLVPACRHCNLRRGTKPYQKFVAEIRRTEAA